MTSSHIRRGIDHTPYKRGGGEKKRRKGKETRCEGRRGEIRGGDRRIGEKLRGEGMSEWVRIQ